MRILTLIRQVLDAEESVRVRNGAVELEGSKLVMDTMDEYGVEEALRLRESGAEAEIVAVAVGPARAEEALRTALAMGADRGRACGDRCGAGCDCVECGDGEDCEG